jgi:hypothetical protein
MPLLKIIAQNFFVIKGERVREGVPIKDADICGVVSGPGGPGCPADKND